VLGAGTLSPNGGWAIGAGNNYYSDSVTGAYFDGAIDNVAIYDYALTPGMIGQHYQVGLTGRGTNSTPAELTIQTSSTNIVVSWNYGFLQQAPAVTGPWTYVAGAASPCTIAVTNSASALYFRATLLPQ
jgi:hypothetical protein